MTIVRRPSPFGELMSLRSAMDRLFEDSFVHRPFGQGFEPMAALPLDVTRTPDELVVEAALPGIKPDDVDITIEDGTLSIRSDFREESARWLGREARLGDPPGQRCPLDHPSDRPRDRQDFGDLRGWRVDAPDPEGRIGEAKADPDQPEDRRQRGAAQDGGRNHLCLEERRCIDQWPEPNAGRRRHAGLTQCHKAGSRRTLAVRCT
jgi:hypothetical protein